MKTAPKIWSIGYLYDIFTKKLKNIIILNIKFYIMFLCDEIIKIIIDFCDIPTMFSMYINKDLTKYIDEQNWKTIWFQMCQNKKSIINEFEKKTTPTSDNEYKNIVRLAGFNGCMICNKKNIRKVWWEFNIRCCLDCLTTKTIGEWEFEKKLPKETYSQLPYTTKQMYNRYFGNYIIKFYWKKNIDELLLLYPQTPLQPPIIIKAKIEKVKKVPTHKEIENQKLRKIEIDNLCISNNILLTDAVTMSETYKKTINVMAKLQKKKFIDTKIPEIKKEIEIIKEREIERLKILEKTRLEQLQRKKDILEKQQIQNELWLMYKEDKLKYIINKIKKHNKSSILSFNRKNLHCQLCENSNRQFCLLGLKQHQKDIHKIELQI